MNKTKLNKIQRALNSLIIIFGAIAAVLGVLSGNAIGAIACGLIVATTIVARGLEHE